MKKLFTLLICMIGIALFTGCHKEINQLAEPKAGDTVAEIVVQDYGTIYVRLFDDAAPKAVKNFSTHAKEGYYNGLSIYRIIEGSRIESGDPDETGSGGESIWGEDFDDEFDSELQPIYGALCMANSGPDTNGSRFFIVQASQMYNNEILDQIEQTYDTEFNKKTRKIYARVGGTPCYYRLNTVFGQVYKGYDVLKKIAHVNKKDEELGVPAEDVVIEKINITQ